MLRQGYYFNMKLYETIYQKLVNFVLNIDFELIPSPVL